ncbi:spermidine synthase, partial [bacterium]|nr:spermidine synthase [bacterium]
MIRFLVVVALFSASGIAALLYQVVWIRQLSHLLGGTSLAISSVLAVFMGGLAAGSRFFGDRADRAKSPLRLYALLEVGIGVAGALVPLAILVAEPVYVAAAHTIPRPLWPLLR